MVKKLIAGTLSTVMIVGTASAAQLFVDDKRIATDVPPQIISGRTLVPVRPLFESLGATVSWNESTMTATAKKENTVISITIGSKTALVNGKPKTLDVAAQTINSRSMVPARFIAEALDATVDWDANTESVYIRTVEYNRKLASAHGIPGVPDGWERVNEPSRHFIISGLSSGDLIKVNGVYWASPKLIDSFFKENIVYSEDISSGNVTTPKYPELDANTQVEAYVGIKSLSKVEGILTRYAIEEMMKNPTSTATITVKDIDILKYCMPSIPSNFIEKPVAGTYDGIKVIVSDGKILMRQEDLKAKGFLE